MKLLTLFFGYALMSAAWNMPNFNIINLLAWLFGLSLILSGVTYFLEGFTRVMAFFESQNT